MSPREIDVDKAIDLADRLVSMLRKLEWSSGGGYSEPICCPECTAEPKAFIGDPRPGCGMHYPGCELKALLDEVGR